MSKFIPNSFQVPNAFIDEMLHRLSGNACKIYLLIVRKTRGWNKESDRISYSQIQKLTGIGSPATVDKAVSELVDLGLIIYKKGNEKSANEYRLNDEFTTSKNEVGGTSENEVQKNCSTSKNVVATSKNEVGGTSKNEDTEIHNIKYTNKKYSISENAHENQESETQEDKKTKSSKNKKSAIEKPEELDEQIWVDFKKVKKQRTKSELTETAWNRFFNQVMLAQEKTGHSLNEIFSFWIANVTWCGFDVNWYLKRIEQQNQQQGYAQQIPQGNQRMNKLNDLYQQALAEEQGKKQQEQRHDYW